MRELFKTHFALTDKGAKDLQKASAASCASANRPFTSCVR